MHSILLTILVAASPAADVETANPREARARFERELTTGSLIAVAEIAWLSKCTPPAPTLTSLRSSCAIAGLCL